MPALTLLDGVRWRGVPIPGDRPAALLAALALEPGGLADEHLADRVWRDDPPAHPAKALQVLVSRLRRLDRGLLERTGHGYRLGLARAEVDAWLVRDRAAEAESRLRAGDPAAALVAVAAALDHPPADDAIVGPVAELRAEAGTTLDRLQRVRGLAHARTGQHAEALADLTDWYTRRPDDTEATAELLRSEAALHGPAVALDRYERYRADLADRLGVDPDPVLRRVHAEILGADRPVRSGLIHHPVGLLGRDRDLARLRASIAISRLTTVLGPGGIGKTSVAQVLAAESRLPRVHLVELVGIVAGDDVVSEVGAALGIRGSVTRQTRLTPGQLADVRGRIAQELDGVPTLLVLDNCEHVLEPVAALVAYLLATTADLRVLATSRAPLRVAAEQVVPLSQLSGTDARDLFVVRAHAVRPDAVIDPEVVDRVVSRLDGLPLAVELAAARVRTMTVPELAAALDDRFAVLRSRERGAPDRHRTLAAVIGWSWDLLSADEQWAMARLSVVHDGVDPSTAEALLGPAGRELVEGLVDQSLLVVTENDGSSRFRALETIREYAARQLDQRGERAGAEAAQQDWALRLAVRDEPLFVAVDQLDRLDALVREEGNLTDVLRRAIARRDPETLALLLVTLGEMWVTTGAHGRLFAVLEAVTDVLVDWDPPAGLLEPAQDAVGLLLMHADWLGSDLEEVLARTMRRWGEPVSLWGRTTWAMFAEDDPITGLLRLTQASEDPVLNRLTLLWLATLSENAGDLESSARYAEEALALGPGTVYLQAALHSHLAGIAVSRGQHRRAAEHARTAWPLLERLHAHDDAQSMRVQLGIAALLDGDLTGCEAELLALGDGAESGRLGSRTLLTAAWAELHLARGDLGRGLAGYAAAVDQVAGVRLPGMPLSPWLALSGVGSLVALARFSGEAGRERSAWVQSLLIDRWAMSPAVTRFGDLPFSGLVMVGLASAVLRFGEPAHHGDALRLLAIAHRWQYHRGLPVAAWPHLVSLAEEALPGALAARLAEVADQAPAELIGPARVILERVTGRSLSPVA